MRARVLAACVWLLCGGAVLGVVGIGTWAIIAAVLWAGDATSGANAVMGTGTVLGVGLGIAACVVTTGVAVVVGTERLLAWRRKSQHMPGERVDT